jgi:hypothetical protein
MTHLPESMVKFEAGQVDEGYFILALSLHTRLEQLPCDRHDWQGPSDTQARPTAM